MQKYIVVTSLLLSMLAGQALAQNKDSQDERKPPRPEFSSIDSNNDGIVELSEFAALPHPHDDYETIFNHIDANADGVISEQEFNDHKPPRKNKR
ncbi:EF-hand domain-containing protein [Shewanella holmiensis]|uniref:EF-hand domain-containing protein n=1 Tax=Shewanella holmiensis TaxID=2952222 RepID=A0A9X2WJP7_9GAMM|nr:EF-hand domain-containing protein [Shewanella holmiensis]MCT7940364.1 EF-hand domain-containing protein [Shewanella holmiensis]